MFIMHQTYATNFELKLTEIWYRRIREKKIIQYTDETGDIMASVIYNYLQMSLANCIFLSLISEH